MSSRITRSSTAAAAASAAAAGKAKGKGKGKSFDEAPIHETSSAKDTTSTPTSRTKTTRPTPILFWREYGSPDCYLSQWYASPFHTGDANGIIYETAEQYMMHQKALLFSDADIASKILETSSPKAVKALGRQVSGFSDPVWHANRSRIVEDASYFKFKYGRDEGELGSAGPAQGGMSLKQRLFETGDREIVEASPLDKIWGIGFGAARAEEMREKWGLNLLGKALMAARERLRKEDKESK